jgi:hypothetical protein
MIASRSIQNKGGYIMGCHEPFPVRLWARCLQLLEWAIVQFHPFKGEELLVIAEK